MNRQDRRASQRAATRAERVEPTTSLPTRERTSAGQFLREVRQELRKVNWPSRDEVVSYTLVVLFTTAFLTLLVWAVDWVISNAVLNVFG